MNIFQFLISHSKFENLNSVWISSIDVFFLTVFSLFKYKAFKHREKKFTFSFAFISPLAFLIFTLNFGILFCHHISCLMNTMIRTEYIDFLTLKLFTFEPPNVKTPIREDRKKVPRIFFLVLLKHKMIKWSRWMRARVWVSVLYCVICNLVMILREQNLKLKR